MKYSGTWREEGMPSKNALQLQRQPRSNSQNNTWNKLREFFMTLQGEISWQYKGIWFHIYYLSSKLPASPL